MYSVISDPKVSMSNVLNLLLLLLKSVFSISLLFPAPGKLNSFSIPVKKTRNKMDGGNDLESKYLISTCIFTV